MSTLELELPAVAHIVAEWEEDADEFDVERLVIETWISPSRMERRAMRPRRSLGTSIAIALGMIGLLK